jgi:hypothetical protein
MKGPAEEPGPLPKFDHCGYEVAIQIVVSSLGAGRYSRLINNGIPCVVFDQHIPTKSELLGKQTQTQSC